MKNFGQNIVIITVVGICLFFIQCKSQESIAREQAKIEEITDKIESQDYKFIARNAVPTGYKNIYLDSSYFLKVSQDTIEAYLPYYGRAYQAPLNYEDSGIKFISTDFSYNASYSPNKKTWEIIIKPNDTRDGIQLFMTIGNTGYADLRVQHNTRSPISFQGIIE